jgi:hypothetical protein
MEIMTFLGNIFKSMAYHARYDEYHLITNLCLTLNYYPYEM